MPKTILVYAIAMVALTAASANAQWFPYPGPVIGYPPGLYQGRSAASVRTQVTPRETQVFVDGYSAGVADDFDGVFQRLQLVPGQHEILFYLPGYRAYRENVYLNPGSSHNIRHTMVARPAGEPDEAPPVPRVMPMAGRGMPPGPIVQTAPQPSRSGTTGTLALRVQPGDANVLIDGEQVVRLTVPLAEGRHHLQIEKAGFQTFSVDLDVRADETTSLNVSLLAR